LSDDPSTERQFSKPWAPLLLREAPVEIFLNADRPEELESYPEPYVERTLKQFRKTGLLDEDFGPTEEGKKVRNALTEVLELEGGVDDEIAEMRGKAEEGVSVVERGRILRKLAAMEREASEEEKERISEVRELLDT